MTYEEWIEFDKKNFEEHHEEIGAKQIGLISHIGEDTKEDVFYMLMFCLLVPQSRQVLVLQAEKELRKRGFYNYYISEQEIAGILKGKVRFHNVKTTRIFEAKKIFLGPDFWDTIKKYYEAYHKAINTPDCFATIVGWFGLDLCREYLMKQIKGLGMKTSGHFMRNIGMPGLAILDTHVRKALQERGMGNAKSSLSFSEYYDLENEMIVYAECAGMTIEQLDFLWCGLSK
jgi:N-glycosylase/DNA lyase